MTDGYISDKELKCSDCYIRNSCDLHPSTCNKRLSVFDAEGLKIHDAKVRADAIDETLEDLRKWLWNNDKSTYHYLNNYYIAPKKEWLKEQKDDKN